MGTFTNFIKLHKPGENEKYAINIFNANAELIDSALAHMEHENENRDNLLDTLNTKTDGITAALISAWNTVTNKVDKVAGKVLSTNDYTTEEKDKLNGIESGANANVQADWSVSDTDSDAYIKNKPDFTSYTPSAMTGATESAAGAAGSVPAPAMGKHNAYLRGDGTWQETSTSLAANVSGIPLDQTAGKMLKDQIDEMNTGLSALEGQLNNLYKIENVSSSFIANAYGGASISIPIPKYNGYKAIGIIGFGSNSPSIHFVNISVGSENLYSYIGNRESIQVSGTVNYQIFYIIKFDSLLQSFYLECCKRPACNCCRFCGIASFPVIGILLSLLLSTIQAEYLDMSTAAAIGKIFTCRKYPNPLRKLEFTASFLLC